MASNAESDEQDGPIDPDLGTKALAIQAGRNNQNMMVTETQINTRTMGIVSNRPASQEINPLPMQTISLGNEQCREPTYAQSGSNNVAAFHGSKIYVNHYHGSQGKTSEQGFTEWANEQDLSEDTVKLLKQRGITSKGALLRAKDEHINALLPLLPVVQRDLLIDAKASLNSPRLPAISSVQNMIESSSDDIDGITRSTSRASISSTSSAQSSPAQLASPAQPAPASSTHSTSEPPTPTHLLDKDGFLFELSNKTLCTPTSIQGVGLKLLKFNEAVSQCQHDDKRIFVNNIYMKWRKQMREQQKTPDEMVELLQCALSETRNVRALKFLNISLDPSSELPQTLFDEDEFFLELAKKTLDPVRVGTKLLRSMAEVDNCSRNMCDIYLTWYADMIINKVSYEKMQQVLWGVLHATGNGEAKDFLETKLRSHKQLETAASLANNAASTS